MATALGLRRGERIAYRTRATGEIVHRISRNGVDGWSDNPNPVAHLLDVYNRLGIPAPDGIADTYNRARALKTEAGNNADSSATQRRSLTRDVAAGKVAADKAADRLEKLRSEQTETKQRNNDRRDLLNDAAYEAYRNTLSLLHNVGDSLLVPFRETATRALDEPDSLDAAGRWELAHDAAAILRRIGAIPTAKGAKPIEYQLGDLHAWHMWRCTNADRIDVYAQIDHDNGTDLLVRITGGPKLTFPQIARMRDVLAPGLYTATEVVEHHEADTIIR